MIPELGHFALLLALSFACCQILLRCINDKRIAFYLAPRCVYGHAFFLLISYLLLTYSFLVHDFSVAYVAEHAHTRLPWPYRISAVWAAHEGSILLWTLLLSVWSAAFVFYARKKISLEIQSNIIAVLGLLSVGFLSFIVFTSNPFLRLFPDIPQEGLGLNPLLQDPGLAIHPPMLYMGYVGFAVTFAIATAALFKGEFDTRWVSWMKPWVVLAWSFLTLGITLGSWWAYRVLGWGGWWFWDPVENASLLPWLTATALFHSLMMVQRRNAFKMWVILLAILTFCLSLLGTFLVRSGVLISVHAFANDPLRGSFLLKFLVMMVGGTFILFAWRSPKLSTPIFFHFFSKETFLLINNIILFVLMLSILFGTIYPLILEVMHQGKISVGPPYFNFIFIPLILPLMLAMSIGPFCYWQKTPFYKIIKKLIFPFFFSLLMTLFVFLIFKKLDGIKIISLFITFLLLSTTFIFKKKHRRFGMTLAHVGVGVCAIGVILSTALQAQKEIRMNVGDTVSLSGYEFKLNQVQGLTGENYEGVVADVGIHYHGQSLGWLYPEKRRYVSSMTIMSIAAIRTNLFNDLYIILGEPLDHDSWAVRIYVKPFVRFIWLGGLLMMLGGVFSLRGRT